MSAQLDIDLARIGDYTIDDVLAWAGDDDARRLQAVEAEQARGDDARSTLLKRLEPKPAAGDYLVVSDHPIVTSRGSSYEPGDELPGDALDLNSDHDQHLLADGQLINLKETR